MKILCFIDSLGPGGAQRQLVMIAVGLKKRGHQVRFLVYHREDHFLPLLQSADIPCQGIPPCTYAQRVLAVRRILRQGWQDVVLAFLEASSLYAELACLPCRRWGLVVGERLADPKIKNRTASCLRHFHRLADAIVCNSYSNQLMLEAAFPFLKKKLCTVYNAVNMDLFHESWVDSCPGEHDNPAAFRIVVAANYHEKKNMMNVGKALLRLKGMKNAPRVVVDWFGTVQPDTAPFKSAEAFIANHDLGASFRLHHTTENIAEEFFRADAVGLFSFFEGLPNSVCEGMACGKPILLSNVCDADNLVQHGGNGYLCNPNSPEDMADRMHDLAAMSEFARRQMGQESRRMAERLFATDIVIDRYERILTKAVQHDPISGVCSWPSEAPTSAVRTANRWAQGI